MEECVFCRIIDGKIPCSRIAESENFLVFLDANPITEGHALVVPRQHSTNLLDLPEYLGNEFLELTQRTAQAIISITGATGFNLGMNNGPAAGQLVMHTHFHIIPRYEGDGLRLWPGRKASPGDLRRLAERIHVQ